ncbi:MAG: hypothetical protein WBD24_05335 [Candidatus Omnitrophota bacterium]
MIKKIAKNSSPACKKYIHCPCCSYSQHISYKTHGKPLEEKLEEFPAFLRKIAYTLLVPATV